MFAAAARDAGARVVTFGTDERADVRLVSSDEGRAGFRAVVDAPSGRGTIELALRGRFNLLNALGVVALGEGLGLDPAAVRAGLAAARGVPGRMEQIDAGQPFQVVVDYAHTPASLEAVLGALGPGAAASGGGLIVVLGSAGERDVAKRPVLGRIAGERCRLVVVTDEDPRGEDRATILEAIAAGAEAVGRRRGVDLLCIPDRRTAIRSALDAARPGDVVLLAGKGHEQSIIQADHVDPWDERAEAVAALADLGFVAG
jgi:UDP-N-acetylmuramoyl-L-alanyl-D-glutamate--2,6-diaminopimelate ligase